MNNLRILQRIIGGVVGGGGVYLWLTLFDRWSLEPNHVVAASGLGAGLGLLFGAKVWELITHL